MFEELDTVVLVRDLENYGLEQGDIGAVVHCYGHGSSYEVEFVTGEGRTVALIALAEADLRPLGVQDVLHARTLEQTVSI